MRSRACSSRACAKRCARSTTTSHTIAAPSTPGLFGAFLVISHHLRRDLTSLADLANFPFTSKADLRATYPFGLFAVRRERIARIHASSGTTGKPTVVGYTKGDIDTWAGLVARSIRAAGASCWHASCTLRSY